MKKQAKIIEFNVPLHISQNVKIRNGEYKIKIKTDCIKRLLRWFKNLFFERIEIGAEYKTIREGYFWIGKDGNIERIEPPTIFNNELLATNIAISINMTSDETKKNERQKYQKANND